MRWKISKSFNAEEAAVGQEMLILRPPFIDIIYC